MGSFYDHLNEERGIEKPESNQDIPTHFDRYWKKHKLMQQIIERDLDKYKSEVQLIDLAKTINKIDNILFKLD